MSDRKKIVIEFPADGSWTVSPEGWTGAACREATEGIERALGKTTARRETPAATATRTQKRTV